MQCGPSSRSTWAAWARASRTSTTSSSAATDSSRTRARSRTSTWKASATRPWRRSPTRSSTRCRSAGRPTWCAIASRSTATRGWAPLGLPPRRSPPTSASNSCASSPSSRGSAVRVLLGAFGDPGHAFPMLALGRALAERGHEVTLQTWTRWREHVEAEGLAFVAAPEYQVFPTGPEPLEFYEAVVRATEDTLPLVRELAPDVLVADILTLAPALAGELAGVPSATLIPHVYPHGERDFPIYSLGARLPRSEFGRALWRRAQGPVDKGLELGRAELNATRARLGLGPLGHV